MPDLAYVNGTILPIEKALVPIEDRGYQFGDAVYEFIASYDGRLFMLEPHLDRLERSTGELGYDPVTRSDIRTAALDLLKRSGYPRAGIYVQISRGVAPRNHAILPGLSHQIIMAVRPVQEIGAEKRSNGARVITVPDIRWGRCDIKTVQLLANTLAKQKAIDAGCDDAIFVSDQGIAREGTSSNLFVVQRGRLTTHPVTSRILAGITRMVVIDLARSDGLDVQESVFGFETLYGCDEAFLTGTVTEVLPVVAIDGRPVGNGSVGPISRRLYARLREQALTG